MLAGPTEGQPKAAKQRAPINEAGKPMLHRATRRITIFNNNEGRNDESKERRSVAGKDGRLRCETASTGTGGRRTGERPPADGPGEARRLRASRAPTTAPPPRRAQAPARSCRSLRTGSRGGRIRAGRCRGIGLGWVEAAVWTPSRRAARSWRRAGTGDLLRWGGWVSQPRDPDRPWPNPPHGCRSAGAR